jgi:16S rRNA processing protein RimM
MKRQPKKNLSAAEKRKLRRIPRMSKQKDLSVGKIAGIWGTEGCARVMVTPERVPAFLELNEVFIKENRKKVVLHIDDVWILTKGLRVKFREFESVNDVEAYKGSVIYAKEASVRETLKPGEYLITDLIGMMVYDMTGKRLGFVHSVKFNGAQDILEIEDEFGKLSLVPFVDELVPEVNLDDNSLIVKPIDGLITK